MSLSYTGLLCKLKVVIMSYILFLQGHIILSFSLSFKTSHTAKKFKLVFKVEILFNILRTVIVSSMDFTEIHQKFKYIFTCCFHKRFCSATNFDILIRHAGLFHTYIIIVLCIFFSFFIRLHQKSE